MDTITMATDEPAFKIGLLGIGLGTYWDQFDGLKKRLEGYLETVHQKLTGIHPDVIHAGLVDSIDTAFAAGKLFRQQQADIIFVYVSTYALSSTLLPVVQLAKVPVVILDLSAEAAIDYEAFNKLDNRTKMTGEWLAYCNACPVPEIANVFKRSGIPFYQVTGLLHNDEACWKEVYEWIQAAKVKNTLFYNRMGCMGHYYGGMLDIYSDLTLQNATFGGHFEMIEVDELSGLRKTVSENEIHKRVAEFHKIFDVQPDCPAEELTRAARTSVALDVLVQKYKLGSFAYYYKGTGNAENEDTMSSVIVGHSLLTATHIPVAGEYEIKNAQAMKIIDAFGAGGSFTEYYAMDYKADVVLMGHDGPGHIAIAEGKIKIRPLQVYHGKVGKGLSVEMTVKHGPVTLLSVVEKGDGKIMLLCAQGESVPGPILEIGNTNSRYAFPLGAKGFVEAWNNHGPAHHCAVGIGHICSSLKKLALLLDIDIVQVC